MRADARRAIAVFEAAGDQRGLVRAWNLLASIEWVLGPRGERSSMRWSARWNTRGAEPPGTRSTRPSGTHRGARQGADPRLGRDRSRRADDRGVSRGAERWTRSCAMRSRTSALGSASSTRRVRRWTGTVLLAGYRSDVLLPPLRRGRIRPRDARRRGGARLRRRRGSLAIAEQARRRLAVPRRVPGAGALRGGAVRGRSRTCGVRRRTR